MRKRNKTFEPGQIVFLRTDLAGEFPLVVEDFDDLDPDAFMNCSYITKTGIIKSVLLKSHAVRHANGL